MSATWQVSPHICISLAYRAHKATFKEASSDMTILLKMSPSPEKAIKYVIQNKLLRLVVIINPIERSMVYVYILDILLQK